MDQIIKENPEQKNIINLVLVGLGLNIKETDLNDEYIKDGKQLQTFQIKFDGHEAILRIGFEKKFSEAIDKEIFLYRDLEIKKYTPELLKHGINEGCSWLLYKKVKGMIGGNVYQFNQSVDFIKVVDAVIDLQQKSTRVLESDKLTEFSSESWQNLIHIIISKNTKLAQSSLVQKILKTLKFVPPKHKVLTHGDLHPANIILNNNGVKIIDWEGAKINSPAFDLSFILLRAPGHCKGAALEKMNRTYPEITAEAQSIFLVNALRDAFEWQLITDNCNELLTQEQLLNGVNAEGMAKESLEKLEDIHQNGLVAL